MQISVRYNANAYLLLWSRVQDLIRTRLFSVPVRWKWFIIKRRQKLNSYRIVKLTSQVFVKAFSPQQQQNRDFIRYYLFDFQDSLCLVNKRKKKTLGKFNITSHIKFQSIHVR